jgi:chloride channel 2
VVFMLLLGVVTAGLGAVVNIVVDVLQNWHTDFMNLTNIGIIRWLSWVSYYILLLFVAIFITKRVPTATGSGIPEMKSILSGVHLHQYLSLKTLIVKMVGLPLSVGSGAFLGKEGPFVHMASMVARQMARLGLFSRIRENRPVMMQVLSAGIAVGVACNFGAPIGGVLFSIEVASTYYPVRNYWSCYLSALPAALLFRYFWNAYFTNIEGSRAPLGFRALLRTSFDTEAVNYDVGEIFAFMLLGAMTGLLGVGFVRLNSFYIRRWKWFRTEYVPKLAQRKGKKFEHLGSPYFFAAVVSLITGFLTFPDMIGDFMGLGSFRAAKDLFSNCSLTDDVGLAGYDEKCPDSLLSGKDWGNLPIFLSLFLFATSRFLLIPLSIMLQTPLGLYTPVLATGAAFGRLFGELVDLALDDESGGNLIAAGGYAVAGAAALCAGATHTLSSAVILFELTGQIHHLMPTLVAVVISVAVSKKFSSLSIYDSIGRHRNLPFLPDLQQSSYDVAAGDIMVAAARRTCITNEFRVEDVVRVLAQRKDTAGHIPVVSPDGMLLAGAVSRESLSACSGAYFQSQSHTQAQLAASATRGSSDSDSETREREEELARTSLDTQQALPGSLRPDIESAVQVYRSTPLVDVHLLLMALQLDEVFVTQSGRLVGLVSRERVKQTLLEQDANLTILGD